MLRFLVIIISFILLLIIYFLSFRGDENLDKYSTFECGFEPFREARLPFSLRFFLLAVYFIVFDVELVFLLPIPILEEIYVVHVLVVILIIGLFHE